MPDDECAIDLSRAPFLREMLGLIVERPFTETEEIILLRLHERRDLSGEKIANEFEPPLEEMETWFSLLALERDWLVYRDAQPDAPLGRHDWRITGCGRLFIFDDEPHLLCP